MSEREETPCELETRSNERRTDKVQHDVFGEHHDLLQFRLRKVHMPIIRENS